MSYYDLWKGTEALDIIKASLSKEEYLGFLKGNILKYQLRLGKKDEINKEIAKIHAYQQILEKELLV